MSRTIYLPKWTAVLVALYNTPAEHRYSGRMHRQVGMTTRHLRNIVAHLEDMDIVRRECRRKIKYIQLTERGVRLAELLLEIYPTLKR